MDVLIDRCARREALNGTVAGCLRTADGGKRQRVGTVIGSRVPKGPLTTSSPTRPFSGACAHMSGFGNPPVPGLAH